MESVSELQTQWSNRLAAYGEQKTAQETQIRAARDSLENAKTAAPSGAGFLAKLKGAIGGGITTLNLKHDIRKGENAIEQLEKGIAQDCRRIFDRLVALAVETSDDGALRQEMQASTALLARLAGARALLDRAITETSRAASAQEDAFAADEKALSLEAQDKSEEALETLDALAAELSRASEETVSTSHALAGTVAELQELVKNTICFNMRGGGRVLNQESAEAMRAAEQDLAGLKTTLAALESRTSTHAASLSQVALQRARAADPAIQALFESLESWLPSDFLKQAA